MEEMYNIVQASRLLGIKVRTVRDWISKGKLRAQKYECSNRWYISESEINRVRGSMRSIDHDGILLSVKAGNPVKEVAGIYDVSLTTVYNIMRENGVTANANKN